MTTQTHRERCQTIVDSWPDWKKEVRLGKYSPTLAERKLDEAHRKQKELLAEIAELNKNKESAK